MVKAYRQKGIVERRTGTTIPDMPRALKPKTEDKSPQLARDILELVKPDSQRCQVLLTDFFLCGSFSWIVYPKHNVQTWRAIDHATIV
ncbi:MAG: hypothetical protein O3A00_07105 [Planctomycetota bacterium]|nr:hypothetical protein [Planctomycetota bacterium]